MGVIRFTGANSREAMRRVRAALGDDALILANRPSADGVEILAMADDAISHLTPSADASPLPPERRTPGTHHAPHHELRQAPHPSIAPPSTAPPSGAPPAGQEMSDPETSDPETRSPETRDLQSMSARLLSEMQDMRALLSREQERRHPETDCAGRLRRILREAGCSHGFAQELVIGLPREFERAAPDDERPLAWLQRQLASRLSVGTDEESFFQAPGITALVGPTGVGKTTTTAKLAARYVERHGADRVALVTTDSFRIGAHEQLRIYAELLGIPMVALDSDQPVDSLATRLMGRRWVIIDTAGRSQRDQQVVEQIAHLQGGRVKVQMMLVLNAASQPETLDEVIRRYREAAIAAGSRLDRCLLSKQDEACRLAPTLETIIRHELTLCFVSHGQRVPEDVSLADASALAARALATRSPLTETPASAPPGPTVAGRQLLGQGRRIASSLTRLRHRVPGFNALERAWDLSSASAVEQQDKLPPLLRPAPHSPRATGLLWAPRRPASKSTWRLPDMLLDTEGLPRLPLRLQHRQPAGDLERLEAALAEQMEEPAEHGDEPSLFQLFPNLPGAAIRQQLQQLTTPWLARLQPATRVIYQGESRPVSQLAALAESGGQLDTRLRGKAAKASLARLAVSLPASKQLADAPSQTLHTWHATLYDAESGRQLGKRYWLSPLAQANEAQPLLRAALHGEGLEPLTRQAMATLNDWLPTGTRAELTLVLAAGVAALASHLEHAEDEQAMDLRAALLELLGTRQRRRDTALLQALLQLFATREAIRHIQTSEETA